jgi:hypothetical protein
MASLIWRLSAGSASFGVLPSASFLSQQARPLVCRRRIWVIAAMWIAWLSRRLPRRDSRQAFRPPEDTSMGAVPLQAAK